MENRQYHYCRISHMSHASSPLFDAGYLALAFSDLATPEKLEKIMTLNRPHELKAMLDKEWGAWRHRQHVTLWNSLRNFKEGDYVLIPIPSAFHVCEIIGKKPILISEITTRENCPAGLTSADNINYWNDTKVDLGFAWEIKIVAKNISRREYAKAALASKLGSRNTNGTITHLKDEIEDAIKNHSEHKPINIASHIKTAFAKELQTLFGETLTPAKFEGLVVKYLKNIGADKVHQPPKHYTGKKGDVDVIAEFSKLQLTVYVQVKFHKNVSDSHGVDQIADFLRDKEKTTSDLAWVITNADDFDVKAKEKADEEDIRLITGLEFAEMILDVGIENL